MKPIKRNEIEELAKWVIRNPHNMNVDDCDVRMGAEFIACCITRLSGDNGEALYPLDEFMLERGIEDREEGAALFLEMFKHANRLMCRYSEEGIYFNIFDVLKAPPDENERRVRFCPYYYEGLKANGKA